MIDLTKALDPQSNKLDGLDVNDFKMTSEIVGIA